MLWSYVCSTQGNWRWRELTGPGSTALSDHRITRWEAFMVYVSRTKTFLFHSPFWSSLKTATKATKGEEYAIFDERRKDHNPTSPAYEEELTMAGNFDQIAEGNQERCMLLQIMGRTRSSPEVFFELWHFLILAKPGACMREKGEFLRCMWQHSIQMNWLRRLQDPCQEVGCWNGTWERDCVWWSPV